MLNAAQILGQKIYEASQTTAAGPSEASSEAGDGDGDVVDADVVEAEIVEEDEQA